MVLLDRKGEEYTFSRKSFSTMPARQQEYSPYEHSSDVLPNLRWELLNSLHSNSPTAIRAALQQTGVLSVSDIKQYVKPRTDDQDPTIRSVALAALVRAGEKQAVPKAIQLVLAQFEGQTEVSAWDAAAVRSAIESVSVPPESLSILVAAMDSEVPASREFASFLLRRSRDWSVVQYLKRALADEAIAVRYNAVMGLAEITGDREHGPAMNLYVASEDEYLNYWKAKSVQ